MSKKKRRKAFSSPSITPEQYSEHLNYAESQDTISSSVGLGEVESTDASAPEAVVERPQTRQNITIPVIVWKVVGVVVTLAAFIVIILAVGKKVWVIEDSIEDMGKEISSINENIKESTRERNIIRMALDKTIGKVEVLFDTFKDEELKNKIIGEIK